jgi:hypothetical protein
MLQVGAVQRLGRRFMRTGVVLLILVLVSGFSIGLSSAAPKNSPLAGDDPKCGGVFSGKTPVDVDKTADKPQAIPGEDVTYTFAWDPVGTGVSVIIDCFQVDGDAKSPLNSIVEASNVELSIAQSDAYSCVNGTRLCYDVTIPIPNDPALIGHSITDRGKLTRGNVETRTNLLPIEVVPPPCTENCGGGTTGDTSGTTTGDTTGTTTGDNGGTTTGGTTTGGTTTGDTTGTTTGGTTTGGTTTGDITTTTGAGTSTGGAENGTTTGSPVVSGDNQGSQVLGRTVTRKPLATTGSATTVLAILGFGLLMIGSLMRFGRFGIPAVAAASGTDELVARSLALVERTVRRGMRDWNY